MCGETELANVPRDSCRNRFWNVKKFALPQRKSTQRLLTGVCCSHAQWGKSLTKGLQHEQLHSVQHWHAQQHPKASESDGTFMIQHSWTFYSQMLLSYKQICLTEFCNVLGLFSVPCVNDVVEFLPLVWMCSLSSSSSWIHILNVCLQSIYL